MDRGPLVFTDEYGQVFRVLGGRRSRPVGSYVWVPPVDFYGPGMRAEAA